LFVFWYHSPSFLDTPRIFHAALIIHFRLARTGQQNQLLNWYPYSYNFPCTLFS
jgi:hypothetical protein